MITLKRSISVVVCLILFASCTKSIDGKKEKSNIDVRKEITHYKDNPFTGEIFENYENGQLSYKENFKDGKKDGLSESYYENGQLRHKNNFKHGKHIDGLCEIYNENGQLVYKTNHKDGEQNGPFAVYKDDGTLSFKGTYKDGKRID